jgi:hypothetical protein
MKFILPSYIWNKPGMTPAPALQQLWRELELCDEPISIFLRVEHHFPP